MNKLDGYIHRHGAGSCPQFFHIEVDYLRGGSHRSGFYRKRIGMEIKKRRERIPAPALWGCEVALTVRQNTNGPGEASIQNFLEDALRVEVPIPLFLPVLQPLSRFEVPLTF